MAALRLRQRARELRDRIRPRAPDVGSADQMSAAFRRLRASGVSIDRVVDVGAFRGQWTELLRQTYPAARSLVIEPQDRHAAALADYAGRSAAETVYVRALVGSQAAPSVPFHVLDDVHGGTGSSVLKEVSNVEGHVEYLPVRTLADILADTAFGIPELLKIDVQGYELEVLKGLGDLISHVDFVLLEVALIRYNDGAPLLTEVVQWMDARDLVVHDLVGETRLGDGTLAQVDVLFVRADHPLRGERVIQF